MSLAASISRDEWQRRLEQGYRDLVGQAGFSGLPLRDLLILSQHAREFTPHPGAARSNVNVEAFARRHGIWLDGLGEHSVTMTPYLHRSAVSEERLTLLGKINIILYYFDDTFGTERQKSLSAEDRKKSAEVIGDLFSLLKTGELRRPPSALERAVIEVLGDLRALTNPEWMARLLSATMRHLELGNSNLDTGATGEVINVDTYIGLRNHVSGMYATLLLIEVSSNNHLLPANLLAAGVQEEVERLRFLCAVLGATVNDCFSFEKEVIDAKDNFNLIPVLMMNDPGQDLRRSIGRAADIINEHTREFIELAARVRERVAGSSLEARILEHVDALSDAIDATWHWQISTKRYQRPRSIWQETRCAPTSNYEGNTTE